MDFSLYAMPNADYAMYAHHIFMMVGHISSWAVGDKLAWYSASSYIVELSNPFIHARYWGKKFQSPAIMFISGVGLFTIYPVTRMIHLPWVWYEAWKIEEEVCKVALLTC